MADIFISYARHDREKIELLAEALIANGLSVWWDRQIGGGAEFSQIIETELCEAKTVIVAWSQHSVGSHWVRDEAEFARGLHKLLPLSLDGVLPPLGFRQLHAIDFASWDESDSHSVFVELVRSLGAKVSLATVGMQQPSDTSARLIANSGKKPCVAILPFANMSSDAEMEFLADGLTEDIITLLSSIRHLSVPARTSAFAFKGQSTDVRAIGEALGARYIVEGSVRKMGQLARVTVQLIAAGGGEHIWAKKFDITLKDLTENPDDIVEKISGSLFAQLTWAEAARSEQADPATLGAWEYCQRTATRIGRAVGSAKTMQLSLLEMEKALTIDPEYALAHALLSWAYNAALICGMYEDAQLEAYLKGAKHHLQRARELAQGDLLTLTYIGACENFAGMQERALHTLEEVLERNPASAEAWYIVCQVYAYLGRFDEARQAINRATELAPEAGFAPAHDWYRGLVEFFAGDYKAAIMPLKRKAQDQPDYGYVNILCAICEDAFGNCDAAGKFIAKAKEHNPQLRPAMLAGIFMAQVGQEKGQREYAALERLWGTDK